MRSSSCRLACAAVLASTAYFAACYGARTTPGGGASAPSYDRVITADEIARSQVSDAWDLLQHTGLFRLQESANGTPTQLRSRRGRSSIVLRDSDTPLLVVDGTRVDDIGILRQITAQSILVVRIMNGRDGTTYYGTNAGAGVIIIDTKNGPTLGSTGA